MCIFKGATKVLLALVLAALVAQGVRAELVNGIGITDPASYDQASNTELTLSNLFNAFFDLKGSDKYTSSDALFADRGVINDMWVALDDAYIYGVGKVAVLVHELNFSYTDGTTLAPITIAANTVGSDGKMTIETALSGFGINTALEKGEFSMSLNTFLGSTQMGTVETFGATYQVSGGSIQNDGLVHLIALDVTDLMSALLGEKIQSAYMFCWEDLPVFRPQGGMPADWDFQDLVYIMVNVSDSHITTITPEPATALILLAGLAVAPLARRLRKK